TQGASVLGQNGGSTTAAAWELPALSASQLIILVWACGFGGGLLMLIVGGIRVARMARRAAPMIDRRWTRIAAGLSQTLSLGRPVQILQSRDGVILAGWGLRRPRLLVPPEAEKWSESRIRMVLCHELAHVRRCDWPVQLLAELARAAYWFNPLVWI